MAYVVPHRRAYDDQQINESLQVDNPQAQIWHLLTSGDSKNQCNPSIKPNLTCKQTKQSHCFHQRRYYQELRQSVSTNETKNEEQKQEQHLIDLTLQNRQYQKIIQQLHRQLNQESELTEELMHKMASNVSKIGYYQKMHHSYYEKTKKILGQLEEYKYIGRQQKKQDIPSIINVSLRLVPKQFSVNQNMHKFESIDRCSGSSTNDFSRNEKSIATTNTNNKNRHIIGNPIFQATPSTNKNSSTLFEQLKTLKLQDLLDGSSDKSKWYQNQASTAMKNRTGAFLKNDGKNFKVASNPLQTHDSKNQKQYEKISCRRRFSQKSNRNIQPGRQSSRLEQKQFGYQYCQSKPRNHNIFNKSKDPQVKNKAKNVISVKVDVRSFK